MKDAGGLWLPVLLLALWVLMDARPGRLLQWRGGQLVDVTDAAGLAGAAAAASTTVTRSVRASSHAFRSVMRCLLGLSGGRL